VNLRDNRDYSQVISFKQLWMKEQFLRLRKIYSKEEVSNDEIKSYLTTAYAKRRLVDGRLYNNTTNSNEIMNQEQFIDLFLNRPYILSGYSAIYENQNNSINIGSAALKFLLDSRKKFKKMQEESEYGSDEYTYYKILQLTFKVLANSYYGILGEKNSVFYNSHVQNSITMTGQDLTTTAICSLENFLADNLQFNDFDDIMRFINEVLNEKHENKILNYLKNKVKNHQDVLEYFIRKTNNLPDDSIIVLTKIINNLGIEEINQLYYKNRMLEFIDDSWGQNILSRLVIYQYTSQPDPEMVQPLNEFRNTLIEFCYSSMIFDDRFKRVLKDERKNIIGSDTDSVFINLNNYILKVTNDLQLDVDNETQQITVMNIFVNIVTEALKRTMEVLTTNMGLLKEFIPVINMKNELNWLLYLVISKANSFNCWNGNQSAAKVLF